MTDDLAMDLDLDGPEKNVYIVNPQKPATNVSKVDDKNVLHSLF